MRMTKDKVLRARVTEGHVKKLNQMGRELGMSSSHILRWLIDNAEISRPVVNFQAMKNSDSAKFSQDASATTVAA